MVRCDSGAEYVAYLNGMTVTAGFENPKQEQLARPDRKRRKKPSNKDRKRPADPDARRKDPT